MDRSVSPLYLGSGRLADEVSYQAESAPLALDGRPCTAPVVHGRCPRWHVAAEFGVREREGLLGGTHLRRAPEGPNRCRAVGLRSKTSALRLGIRPGEARALDVADFTGTHLLVGKAVKGPTSKAPTRGTKNRTPSVVPVNAELADWIREHRHDAIGASPLFVNLTARKGVRDGWRILSAKNGIARRRPPVSKVRSVTRARNTAPRRPPVAKVCRSTRFKRHCGCAFRILRSEMIDVFVALSQRAFDASP